MHKADVVVARVIALLCGSSAREMDASTHQQSVPSKWCSDGGGGLEKMRESQAVGNRHTLPQRLRFILVRKRLAGMSVPNGALDNYTATGKSMVGSSAASAASEMESVIMAMAFSRSGFVSSSEDRLQMPLHFSNL